LPVGSFRKNPKSVPHFIQNPVKNHAFACLMHMGIGNTTCFIEDSVSHAAKTQYLSFKNTARPKHCNKIPFRLKGKLFRNQQNQRMRNSSRKLCFDFLKTKTGFAAARPTVYKS